jgi:hypothetical protein
MDRKAAIPAAGAMRVPLVSERAQAMEDSSMKFGLLMESAQVHQKLAETQLEKLNAHVQDLDGVVRDEIRRTLVEELQMLSAESRRAALVLQGIRRNSLMRGTIWSIVLSVVCTGIPTAIVGWFIPTERQLAALRMRRDELAASVATLESRGGRIDWRRCGATARLCVRIDRSAPTFGENADYVVVAGY